MTELRITTSAFMIFLSIFFVSVILKVYIGKIQVIKTAIVTAGLILALLGVFNVKAVVAGYYYNAYVSGQMETIDVYAMRRLGYEGVPYITKLALDGDNDAKMVIQRYIIDEIYHDFNNGRKRIYDDIGEFSVARLRAYSSLENYYELRAKAPQDIKLLHDN